MKEGQHPRLASCLPMHAAYARCFMITTQHRGSVLESAASAAVMGGGC